MHPIEFFSFVFFERRRNVKSGVLRDRTLQLQSRQKCLLLRTVVQYHSTIFVASHLQTLFSPNVQYSAPLVGQSVLKKFIFTIYYSQLVTCKSETVCMLVFSQWNGWPTLSYFITILFTGTKLIHWLTNIFSSGVAFGTHCYSSKQQQEYCYCCLLYTSRCV